MAACNVLVGGNANAEQNAAVRFARNVEKMSGGRMRIPGHAGEVVERVGMKPVSIPPGELYTVLERGTIDAVE